MATKIDRQTTTPFHLKLFYRSSGFHSLSDFPIPTSSQPNPPLPSHLQIYTWQSCDLKELAHCLTSALPNLLPSPAIGTRLSFRLVYPDTRPPVGRDDSRGRYMSKEIGSVVIGEEIGGDDMNKTLEESRFIVGDFVDCAIFPPLGDGSVAPARRENGYRPRGGYGGRDFNSNVPSGEWRRGERLPEQGYGRGFGRGRGRGF